MKSAPASAVLRAVATSIRPQIFTYLIASPLSFKIMFIGLEALIKASPVREVRYDSLVLLYLHLPTNTAPIFIDSKYSTSFLVEMPSEVSNIINLWKESNNQHNLAKLGGDSEIRSSPLSAAMIRSLGFSMLATSLLVVSKSTVKLCRFLLFTPIIFDPYLRAKPISLSLFTST